MAMAQDHPSNELEPREPTVEDLRRAGDRRGIGVTS